MDTESTEYRVIGDDKILFNHVSFVYHNKVDILVVGPGLHYLDCYRHGQS